MRLAVLQHVPFEGPANIANWALSRNVALHIHHVYKSALPDLETFDALVVLGGPMGVHQEAIYPWLCQEKRWIKEVIASGKKILGICLGAQLLAEAMGASIAAMGYREIGWHPLFWKEEALALPFFSGFPPSHKVLHWHGDRFALPPDSIHLVSSRAFLEQGFLSANHRVLGLQFHLEWDLPTLEALIKHAKADLEPGPFTDHPENMSSQAGLFAENQRLLQNLLDRFFCRQTSAR